MKKFSLPKNSEEFVNEATLLESRGVMETLDNFEWGNAFSKTEAAKNLCNRHGLSFRQSNRYVNSYLRYRGIAGQNLKKEIPKLEPAPLSQPPKDVEKIQLNTKFIYNSENDKYVVFLKSAGKNIVMPGEKHRAMLSAYSNWDGNPNSINEICRNFEFPKKWFVEYKTIMGWTHDCEPVSTEEILFKDEDELLQDILQKKRFSLYQKFQKEDWRQTMAEAEKWKRFCAGVLDPFTESLNLWRPPEYGFFPPCEVSNSLNEEKYFVCGCFDWQIGASADGTYQWSGENLNCEVLEKNIRLFYGKILSDVKSENFGSGFKGAVIILGGDLMHGLRGQTEKGTKLKTDILMEKQFDLAVNLILEFITALSSVFPTIHVVSIRGNHEGFDFYPLSRILQIYFRNEPRISFNIELCRTAFFKVLGTLFLVDHGESDKIYAPIPKNGPAREAHISNLLLQRPELLQGTKQKIFIMGDKHHFEQVEYSSFESFNFGSIVTGDEYSDNLGIWSRARQNCLVVDSDGVKQVIHYYFD